MLSCSDNADSFGQGLLDRALERLSVSPRIQLVDLVHRVSILESVENYLNRNTRALDNKGAAHSVRC